ncbi:hypothetical protein pb186bvf_005854 [Paramecium bursaria]
MDKCVLFILIIVSANASLDTCNKVVDDLIFQYLTGGEDLFIRTIFPYIQVSGLSPFAYGDYDACLREGYLYSTVAIFGTPVNPLHFRFCHSNQCTTDDLSNQVIQQKIKAIIKASHILDPYMDIDKLTYVMFEPNYLQNENKVQFFVTSTIIIILVIFSLIDPIHFHLQQLKQKIELNINEDQNFKQKKQSNFIFEDFSLFKNFQQLMNLKFIDPNLAIFDGLRSIAFFYVLFGHTYDVLSTAVNPLDVLRLQKEWLYILIGDALYSVDIFFWIGGFFIGFVLFEKQKMDKLKKRPLGILLIIVHRFLRIWPCYIFAIFFHCYIGQKIGGGPRWFMTNKKFQSHTCWRNMLFIDKIFILISNIVLDGDGIQVMISILITLGIGIYISFEYEYTAPAIASQVIGQFYFYYIKPYCRAPPYYVGLFLGIQYREHKESMKSGRNDGSYNIITLIYNKSKSNRYMKLFIQMFSYIIGSSIILIFCLGWRGLQIADSRENYGPQWVWYLWHGTCRPIFVIGVTLLCIPCMIGLPDLYLHYQLSFNTKFMNCLFFRFVAKISFCCYLIHYTILTIIMATFYVTPEYTFKSQLSVFIVAGCMTLALALLITLIVEMPFLKLENRLMSRYKNQKSGHEQQLL